MNEDTFALRVLQLNTPEQIRAELERVGADSSLGESNTNNFVLAEQVTRADFHIIKLAHASLPLARLLYQELVMEGGQVVTTPRLQHVGEGMTEVLLCATRYQFDHLIVRLRWQSSDELELLADELERTLDHFNASPPALELGRTHFDWALRTFIMGILNITTDSFSGDGLIHAGDTSAETTKRVIVRAHELVAQGADILDIGGASSHPKAPRVDVETELERVLPVVNALKQEMTVPLSIDTSKPRVAEAALGAGAVLLNDVTGLREAEMVQIAASSYARNKTAVVITHNGRPQADNSDFLEALINELRARVQTVQAQGVAASHILIDPGLGFGKTPAQNLEMLNRLAELRVLGCPILIGPSRKGFISNAIAVPVDEREEGTAAAVALGIARGANMVRVHDVRAMARVARMSDAITGKTKNATFN